MSDPLKHIPKYMKPPMIRNRKKRARKSGRYPHMSSIILIRKGYSLTSRYLSAR